MIAKKEHISNNESFILRDERRRREQYTWLFDVRRMKSSFTNRLNIIDLILFCNREQFNNACQSDIM